MDKFILGVEAANNDREGLRQGDFLRNHKR